MTHRICISVMAKDTADALLKMRAAAPHCGLLEVRLDVMETFDLKTIIHAAPKPVLITYRSRKEGGRGDVPYAVRVDYLLEAMGLGADYVDVEYTMPLEHRRRLFENGHGTKVLLSKHFRNKTPSKETLWNLLNKMAATGAAVVKIVSQAKAVSDNLTVLGLISEAQRLGVQMVAFCMGPLGRVSRVASPLLGGAFTFAALQEGQESAPGQLNAMEMKRILEQLGS